MRPTAGVVLIDADLRHSSIGKYFGVAGRPGLVEYLLGEAEWEACLVSTPQARLRILPAGGHTAMAPELLGSERLHQLITGIRDQYPDHVVVFDGPPILLTADPMMMARHIDHVVLVVRAGVTPRDAVLKAVQAIGAERLIGVVLNGTTESLTEYYHYGRRYGYYGQPADASRS
jgi:capsular exopolysaccharide synthesis family protein